MADLLNGAITDILIFCDSALQLVTSASGQQSRLQMARHCAIQLQALINQSPNYSKNQARMLAIGLFGAVELLLRGEEGPLAPELAVCVRAIHDLAAEVRDMVSP